MPRRLVGAAAALLALSAAPSVKAVDVPTGLTACRQLSDDQARLICYDALVLPIQTRQFKGSGNAITPRFEVSRPSRLGFESQDAVMVIYLLDASGAVVQNLHKAGAGQDSFLIETPGWYSVQINATGGWRVELELPE